jgi:hypothetical protein
MLQALILRLDPPWRWPIGRLRFSALIVDVASDPPAGRVLEKADAVACIVLHISHLAGRGRHPHEVGPRLRQRRVARARERSVRHDANEDRADLFEDGRTWLGRGMDIERAFDREAQSPV